MAKIRVLLVDDEVAFIEMLAERLRARNLEVEIETSGANAVARAAKSSFDLVLLDLAMPEMDGLETMRALLDEHPKLKIVLLTGQATIRSAMEASRLGAVDILEKPIDISTLLERIHAGLGSS